MSDETMISLFIGERQAALDAARVRAKALSANPDVVEIDASAPLSYDDATALRTQAMYAAADGECKVYVIRDAHWLSDDAWRSLFKLCGDPSPGVAFMFLTDERKWLEPWILERLDSVGTTEMVRS